MATPINSRHAANVVAKTLRWADYFEQAAALDPKTMDIPAALIELERKGFLGRRLADAAWEDLAERVGETAPQSTRQAIADELARRAQAKADTSDPFAGLPR